MKHQEEKNNNENVETGVDILFHVSFKICNKVKLYYLLYKTILKNESKIPTLYQSGKTLIPAGCTVKYVHVVPRRTTNKSKQRNNFKNTKICQDRIQKMFIRRQKEKQKTNGENKRKMVHKMTDLR